LKQCGWVNPELCVITISDETEDNISRQKSRKAAHRLDFIILHLAKLSTAAMKIAVYSAD